MSEIYQHKTCGLKNIYLKNGFSKMPNGEAFIDNEDELGKAIANELLSKPGILSKEELRFLSNGVLSDFYLLCGSDASFIRNILDLAKEIESAAYEGKDTLEKIEEYSKKMSPLILDAIVRTLSSLFLKNQDILDKLIGEYKKNCTANAFREPAGDIQDKLIFENEKWGYKWHLVVPTGK